MSPPKRKAIFIIAVIAALVITVLMNIIGKPLMTPEAPAGIVSFELAGTNAQAQLILDLDMRAKLFAALMGFDYLYMLKPQSAWGVLPPQDLAQMAIRSLKPLAFGMDSLV
jgi:hypothetical protein